MGGENAFFDSEDRIEKYFLRGFRRKMRSRFAGGSASP
jgi:hypothetical protein